MRMIHTEVHPSKGWIVHWLAPNQDSTQIPIFDREFTRIVMGIALDDGPHAVVLGERRIIRAHRSAYYYMVLDEAQDHLSQNLFEKIIALKDRYKIPLICSPARPPDLVSALQSLEGLTHYTDDNEHTAEVNWPTFHSFETLSVIRVQEAPEEIALHQALDEHVESDVIDPNTGGPLLDGDGQPVKRLHMPGDFNTQITAAGVRQAAIGVCTALLLAMEALWSTRNLKGRVNDKPREPRKTNPVTGY